MRLRERLEELRREERRFDERRLEPRVEEDLLEDRRDDPRDDDLSDDDPRRAPELARLVDPEFSPFDAEDSPFDRNPEESRPSIPSCFSRLRSPFFSCGGVRGLSSARSTPFLCSSSVSRCLAISSPLFVSLVFTTRRQSCPNLISNRLSGLLSIKTWVAPAYRGAAVTRERIRRTFPDAARCGPSSKQQVH